MSWLAIPVYLLNHSTSTVWGLNPDTLSQVNVLGFLSVLGFAGGALIANRSTKPLADSAAASPDTPTDSDDPRVRRVATILATLVFLSLAIRAATGQLNSSSYGIGQFTAHGGFIYFVILGLDLIIVPGIIYLAVLSARTQRSYPWQLLALVAVYCLEVLATGSRAGALGLLLAVAAVDRLTVRRLSKVTYTVGIALLLALTIIVGNQRGGQNNVGNAELKAVGTIGSGATVESNVLGWVPSQLPHLKGKSYESAGPNLLPSFVTGKSNLLGRNDTGSLFFKNLFERGRFNNNMGYGFSARAEAYWNFGWGGVVVVFAIVGALISLLYRKARTSNFAVAFYCITIGYLPLLVRSDATETVKSLAYAAVFCLFLDRLSRRLRVKASR